MRLPAYLSEPDVEEPPVPPEPPEPLDQLMLRFNLGRRQVQGLDPVRARSQRTRTAAGHLISMVLEALDGRRPLRQLLHTRLAESVHRRLAADLRDSRPGHTHRLRTVHVCEPAEGVIEASGTITAGPRVRAVTARIERTDRGWLCTVFAIL
ncbi:Rv3235 family protein [Allokutzneria sp. NRRL B-24872]|uniref:Rv3235 family protein n=1 Tax=Allokutzneria sp. NRRL B-24872 TaxID=1137961 RepID=UPI001177C12A|nr:Rv3235 family protein [Allokutzneria sp. NRRL B-24872]